MNFCPPERSVSAARSAAIIRDFVQKRFALRPVIATNQDISNFQRKELARSPRLWLGFARFFSIFCHKTKRTDKIKNQFSVQQENKKKRKNFPINTLLLSGCALVVVVARVHGMFL
jgi:hypothetical protein